MSEPTVILNGTCDNARYAAVSNVGMRRAANQDSLAVDLAPDEKQWRRRGHLFVVADGMGAHAAGELASELATDNIPHVYAKRHDLPPGEAILAAINDANARIHAKGQNSVDFYGMGTTCSALLLLPDGAIAAHVGDSRIYRLRGNALEQLTFDHSLVWEMAAAGHAQEEEVPSYVPKNVITRSLGPHPTVKVDLEGPLPVRPGDRYLLCSDGLTGPLNVHLAGMVLASLPPQEAAQTLVDLANVLGGPDNITVVVVEVPSRATLGAKGSNQWNDNPDVGPPRDISADDGYFLGAAGIPAAIALVLAVFGQFLLAGVAALLSVLAAAGWWIRRRALGQLANQPRSVCQGRAPYRRYQVAPSAENVELLSDVVRQLDDLESQRQWPFDWRDFHDDRAQAFRAFSSGDYTGAVVAYSSAVRRLMQAVRETRPPESGSGINLGRD